MRLSSFSLLLYLAINSSALATDTLLTISGTRLFVRTVGAGEPIVVIHGGPGLSHQYLLEPFSSLADRYRVIFYDQRGCGWSDAFSPGDSVTMDMMVNDLEGVRSALGVEHINLVGQSWGAIIAMNYALAYPSRVRRLLLLEPAPGSREYLPQVQQTLMRRLSPRSLERLKILGQMPELRSDPAIFREFLQIRTDTYFADTSLAKVPRFLYFDTRMVKQFFESSAMFGPYMLSFDLHDRIVNIECPTLIVHGDYDVIPTEAIERLGKAISKSEVHIVKECGHFVHLERPDIYFSLIRSFLSKPAP